MSHTWKSLISRDRVVSGDPRSPWSPLRFPPLDNFPPDGPFRYTHLNDAALHFSFPILCFYLPAIVAADLFLARQPRSFIPERVTLRFACGLTWGTAVRNAFLFRRGVFLLSLAVIKFSFLERAGGGPTISPRSLKQLDSRNFSNVADSSPKMNCYNPIIVHWNLGHLQLFAVFRVGVSELAEN